MKATWSRIFFTCALGALLLCPAMCFADDLKLTIGVKGAGGNCSQEPDNKVLTLKHARTQAIVFCVTLTNSSSSSQTVYWETDGGALSFKYFPEEGQAFIVKRKAKPESSAPVIPQELSEGESLIKTVVLDPEEWENRPVFEVGKVKKFTIRAIFNNSGSNSYSQEYTLVLDGR